MKLTQTVLTERQQHIGFQQKAFIANQFVDAKNGGSFAVKNPATGQELTQVASCDAADVDLAVKSARAAFNSGVWRNMPHAQRKQKLYRWLDLIEENIVELALLNTLDMGKPISGSMGEISWALTQCRWIVEMLDKIYDHVAPSDPGSLAMVVREPMGVIGLVLPWNYPTSLCCDYSFPILASGNCVIVKPAEQSPLTALKLAELAIKADLPEGIFQVLPGYGERVGGPLGLHPDVNMIQFIGSREVGKLFLQYSAQSNMKRVMLECGGKSPCIVMPDANLEGVSQALCASFLSNQGEICCGLSRILVHHDIQADFNQALCQAAKSYFPGDPLHPDTAMGSMVDETQMQRVLSYIEQGKEAGATLAMGGSRVCQETGGYFIEPTVFTQVDNKMAIAQEEIFGPVFGVVSFDSVEQAIVIANDTCYGLAASVWTQDLVHAHKISRAIRAGNIGINTTGFSSPSTTFGGYQESGIGRTGGLWQFENYTELKTIIIDGIG